MNPERSEARAVAVQDGRILALGDNADTLIAELQSHTFVSANPDADSDVGIDGSSDNFTNRKIEIDQTYADQVLMPGFIDPHLHPMMASVLLPMEFITPEDWHLPRGDFPGVRTPEGYLARLKTAIASHRSGSTDGEHQPFFTWGWHHLWHGNISRQMLNELDSEFPVIVWHRSFHEIALNDAALEMLELGTRDLFDAAIAAHGADPQHASFDQGTLAETALIVALPKLAPRILAPDHLQRGMASLVGMMRQSGVTTIADMATGMFASFDEEAQIMAATFERPDVPARALLVPVGHRLAAEEGGIEAAIAGMQERAANWPYHKLLLNNRVKVLSDGAFFSQYMQMNPPGYLDGHEGKWIMKPEQLSQVSNAFWQAGFTVHCHVNGDKGLDVVLDMLAALRNAGITGNQQFVLEHLGFSSEEQNRRIAELGARVSAQPNYLYVLSQIYSEQGLGPERAHAISRLGSLERLSVPVTLHSDATMAPVDPLFLAWIAANRENMEGQILRPDERLSLHTALRAITFDAALILGLEHEIGSIEVGKRADFTALAANPYEVGATGLKDIAVTGVVFNGQNFPNSRQ